MKLALKCFIIYLTVHITACSAENQQGPSESPRESTVVETTACTIPEDAFFNLPQDVLAGTDVLPLADFKPVASTEKRSFISEMGGAVLQLNIEYDSNKQLAVVREYVEPGMPAETKRYAGLCINQGRIYGPDVRGIFFQDGLLWLELNSGNGFIPPDLWVLLQQHNK